MHQFGWLSERGGNFLNLLQKEGGTQKGGFAQKRGEGSNPGGSYVTPFSRLPPTPSPFSKIPPFLEIQDVPTSHRSLGKAKVLNNSCYQIVYHFYPQSILVLEECLEKW